MNEMAYSTAKSARRAARKAGLDKFEVVEQEGGFMFRGVEQAAEEVANTNELPVVEQPTPEAGAAVLPEEQANEPERWCPRCRTLRRLAEKPEILDTLREQLESDDLAK